MPLRTHDLAAVLAGARPRCICLHQPTHRHQPDNQQDPILYRNLMKERSLQQSIEAEVASFLEPFDALEHDVEYWTKTLKEQKP